ncbi:hypothetical protein X975_04417, partial [Stegodyphus mimosarum]
MYYFSLFYCSCKFFTQGKVCDFTEYKDKTQNVSQMSALWPIFNNQTLKNLNNITRYKNL